MANNKNKNVSISSVDKILKHRDFNAVQYISVSIDDNDVEISVKKYLTSEEEISCINSIFDSVFLDGEYHPELYDASVLMSLVLYYTNLKVESGIERLYRLRYETDVIQQIVDAINAEQWDFICSAARLKIDYKKHMLQEQYGKELDQLIIKVEQATSVISSWAENFKSIDADTIGSAINKISNIDERQIIDIIAAKQAREEK